MSNIKCPVTHAHCYMSCRNHCKKRQEENTRRSSSNDDLLDTAISVAVDVGASLLSDSFGGGSDGGFSGGGGGFDGGGSSGSW